MEQFTMRKVSQVVGGILGSIGFLLLIGSIVVWQFGPEKLWSLYEASKPALWFFLAGLVLVVVGFILANIASPGTAPGAGAESKGAPCNKCAAINVASAKFCNQCGSML
jgi:hypothetical protein